MVLFFRLSGVRPLDHARVQVIVAGDDADIRLVLAKFGFLAIFSAVKRALAFTALASGSPFSVFATATASWISRTSELTWPGAVAVPRPPSPLRNARAQDDDQPRAEMVDGIFNAPQAMVVDQVAGRADHEQVADVLVEDQFRRGPRVGTTDDDRKGMLGLGRSARRAAVGLPLLTALATKRALPALSRAMATSGLTATTDGSWQPRR